jgi:hypothetical protein
MEERHYFPAAEKYLVREDWNWIDGFIAKDRDPLFGGQVEEAFTRLSQRLISRAGEARSD